MDLSRLRSRRGVLAMALVTALSRVVPVSAQTNGDCSYTFINGLLTIGGDKCGIAVPGHMVDATNNPLNDDSDGTVSSNVDSPKEIRQDRLQRRRDHKRDKRSRNTNQKQDQRDRRRERKILCEDFSTQLQAVEAMAQNPWRAKKLDPDGDGVPCEDLTPLTCGEFSDEAEATNWFNRMGYTKDFDPFKLYDAETGGICTERRTCNDFSNQKQAVEWLTDHPIDRPRLDPDNDGAPCQKLPTVTCKSFSNQQEATNWFKSNKFIKNTRDPYHLYDDETDSICPTKVTCADFSTQKAAVEWMKDHPKDKDRLDENGDGIACPKLPQWSCSSFKSSKEVLEWHEHYKPTNAFWDPYGLYNENADPKRYCSNLPLTTNG